MKSWTPQQIARAAGARLLSPPLSAGGPERVVIDSRDAGPGALFVGLKGARVDGGRFAAEVLAQGAWGALTTEGHAQSARGTLTTGGQATGVKHAPPGALLVSEDPLRSLQALASAWRAELNAQVIGVTGSTGKTSTKDLLLAVLTPHRRTVASRANFNTEIGLPLEILGAPAETEVLVLEMAMRGPGQIAELAAIARPDVGVIVSVGPVHLELLGTVEAIAAAKAELLESLPRHGTAIIPAGEPLLEPHIRDDIETLRFGDGGDVRLANADERRVTIEVAGATVELEVSFTQTHLRRNLLAAVAAASAIGVTPSGTIKATLSPGRGQRSRLANDVTLIDDSYNANPMSVRAALEDLARGVNGSRRGRRVAVLGDMLELGPDERRFHEEIGAYADAVHVDVLITVGPLAAAMGERYAGELHVTEDAVQAAQTANSLLEPGDTVLVKGSRAVGLELVCQALTTRAGAPA